MRVLAESPARLGYLLKDRVGRRRRVRRLAAPRRRRRHGAGPAGRLPAARRRARRRVRSTRSPPREREVLELVAEGRSNKGIGERLDVTERAVQKHVTSIFAQARPGARRRRQPPRARGARVPRGCVLRHPRDAGRLHVRATGRLGRWMPCTPSSRNHEAPSVTPRPPSSPPATSSAATARATRAVARAARRLARHRPRPPDRRDGPVGLRQVDADAHPRRPGQAHLGRGLGRRRGHHRARRHGAHEAAPRPHRLHLPVLQPAPDADGGREHRAAAQARRRLAGRGVAGRAGPDRRARATASRTARPSCRAASSSASPSPARSSRAPA